MEIIGFNKRVGSRQKELGHALCVGLDPNPEKIPDAYSGEGRLVDRVYAWMTDVVDQTADHATVWKPQAAYYERHGSIGWEVLEQLVPYMHDNYPEVPVVLDCKRGDIGRTQQQYREAVFGALGVDAANVSPYMGREPLVDMHDPAHPQRGIITLVYTSNKGAREFQDAMMTDPETGKQIPIWLFSAKLSMKYALEVGIQNLGFVMAAAHNKDGSVYNGHLSTCREHDEGEVPYLMPGFGTQGGFVEASIEAGWAGWGSLYMSASSSISNAAKPSESARILADQSGECIAKMPIHI